MAFASVLIAALVGLVVSCFALIAGDVGIMGALGLYVAAGWATLIAGVLATVVARLLQRPGIVMSDRRKHEVAVLIDRRQPQNQH